MNEFQLINFLTSDLKTDSKNLLAGIGDDCAVVSQGNKDILLSTDSFSEGIHFDFSLIDEFSVGNRVCNASLSDIAAMGGLPRFILVSLGLPLGFDPKRAKKIYEGISDTAKSFDTLVIGGDTISNPYNLFLTLTVIGETEQGKAILRSGASAEDGIYLSGKLGCAALGLECLKHGLVSNSFEEYISKYKRPIANIELGRWLKSTGVVSAMIDISDGLLADIGHICDLSKTGYEIKFENIYRDASFDHAAKLVGRDIESLILSGGDDYELVFTVKKSKIAFFDGLIESERLSFGQQITKIGKITNDVKRRVVLRKNGDIIKSNRLGYDHMLEDFY